MTHGQIVNSDSSLAHYQGSMILKHCKEIVHLQQFISWMQQKLVGTFSNAFIILLVPVFELIVYPLQKVFYPRLNMSMATRIIASIFLMLLSNLSNLTLELVATHGGNK